MKSFLYLAIINVLLLSCSEPESHSMDMKDVAEAMQQEKNLNDSAGFDAALATELGADEYGMKSYVMILLKRGNASGQTDEEVQEIQRGHLNNIKKLAAEHKMVLAGPFMEGDSIRGIFIMNTDKPEEALGWIENDPAVKSGRLVPITRKWYGSAALVELYKLHEKISMVEI